MFSTTSLYVLVGVCCFIFIVFVCLILYKNVTEAILSNKKRINRLRDRKKNDNDPSGENNDENRSSVSVENNESEIEVPDTNNPEVLALSVANEQCSHISNTDKPKIKKKKIKRKREYIEIDTIKVVEKDLLIIETGKDYFYLTSYDYSSVKERAHEIITTKYKDVKTEDLLKIPIDKICEAYNIGNEKDEVYNNEGNLIKESQDNKNVTDTSSKDKNNSNEPLNKSQNKNIEQNNSSADEKQKRANQSENTSQTSNLDTPNTNPKDAANDDAMIRKEIIDKLCKVKERNICNLITYLVSAATKQDQLIIMPSYDTVSMNRIVYERYNTLTHLNESLTENVKFYTYFHAFLSFFGKLKEDEYVKLYFGFFKHVEALFFELILNQKENSKNLNHFFDMLKNKYSSVELHHASKLLKYAEEVGCDNYMIRDMAKTLDMSGEDHYDLLTIFVFIVYKILVEK